MNDVGESCYPTIDTLARETGLSKRAVITHIQSANKLGWIKVGEHGFRGQRWRSHEYSVGMPASEGGASSSPASIEKVVNLVPEGGEPRSKNSEKVVNDVHSNSTVINSTGNSRDCANKSRPPKRARDKFNPETIPIPDWLPRDSWLEWCQHRRDKGKTITQLAASKQIKQLAEYRDQGHEPTAVIDHCIANGYQGLFPPRSTTNEASGRHRKETPLEAGVRELQEMRERIANGNIIEWLNQDGPLPFG
jgi:hypothetical protein